MQRVCDFFWASILFLGLFSPLAAWDKIADNLDINCAQTGLDLDCRYRTLDGSQLQDPKALFREKALALEQQVDSSNKSVAVLFLVDTSDPARQNVIDIKKSHIREMRTRLNAGYQVGLAAFDKSLRIEAPIGESEFLFGKQLEQLKALGRTTELYRNVILALEYLDKQEADTKVMFLMSDGQAEDKAYFHSDVVKVARQYGIIINSIGYPRTVSLSVALQTLRRLSEETGGHYFETSINYELPANYLERLFDNITHTGKLDISLGSLATSQDAARIKLEYTTASGRSSVFVPVQIARQVTPVTTTAAAPAVTTPATRATDANPAPVTIVTRQVDSAPINLWLWYGIPAAFIIIIIFILITLFLLWQRPPTTGTTVAPAFEFKPYAYLIEADSDNARHPITRTICRIGRGKDNELVLDDSSISRRHAEIHRNVHGSFDIIDMNSMNGVFVNGEKIGKAMLQEGDEIEIGDISLKFSQLSPEHAEEESTVMQKTKTPDISIS